MTVGALSRPPWVRVALARLYQRLGLTGLAGCALLLLAIVLAWRTWHNQAGMAPLMASDVAPATAATRAVVPAPPPRALPDPAEVPRLLARIERAATAAGLGWPRADYRFQQATSDVPASVEVRCTLNGPYPAVRRFVTALLQDTPTLTLREFTLSRSGVDAPEVEAKLAIVIYVAERGGAGAR